MRIKDLPTRIVRHGSTISFLNNSLRFRRKSEMLGVLDTGSKKEKEKNHFQHPPHFSSLCNLILQGLISREKKIKRGWSKKKRGDSYENSQSSSQCRNKEGACERRPPVTKWPCPCTNHRCQELPCTREISTPRNKVATSTSDECHPAVARKNFQSSCYALKRRLPSSLCKNKKRKKMEKRIK
ncbi:hypothetical protein V1478_005358 [Vespula squamosa]|uniref:Uncharacterized protein n=1 Tax=Vespula squamosa TaxID=30214 RepID=A0ABD2BE34_VESSQ